jgi:hypothetical protein
VVSPRFNLVPAASFGLATALAVVGVLCVCATKHFIRQFTLLHVHFRNSIATSVHINSGTYVFCAKVTEVIFEIIDRRRAPH